MQGLKAKGPSARADAPKRGGPVRAELVDKAVRGRLEAALESALREPGPDEAKVMGALRALVPVSPSLRASVADAVAQVLKKGPLQRPLYTGGLRALAEGGDARAGEIIKAALQHDEAGGTAALAAACVSRDASLGPVLTKIAGSRQSHLAFSAETARVVRGESGGAHLVSLAPMIKESHRIALSTELFFSLLWGEPVPTALGPSLSVLRSAERHLGRWLVLGEVAARGGDALPVEEAKAKCQTGPQSARSAWSLVLWALRAGVASARGEAATAPEVRPTVELMARLSDRPSADRDPTFLFRLASARVPSTRVLLEALAKPAATADDAAVRAAFYLARDHGRDDLRRELETLASAESPRGELRGLAAVALWELAVPDARARADAQAQAEDLEASPHPANQAWGALLRIAVMRAEGAGRRAESVLTERHYRWVQLGWLE
jgi:hypothetical protein